MNSRIPPGPPRRDTDPGTAGAGKPAHPVAWTNSIKALLSAEGTAALTDMVCASISPEVTNASRAAMTTAFGLRGGGSAPGPGGRNPALEAVQALLRPEAEPSWQAIGGRRTGSVLHSACRKLAEHGVQPESVRVREPISVDRADDWCRRAIGSPSSLSLAYEMAGVFTALCADPQTSPPIAALTTLLWVAVGGVPEYYAGTDVGRPEIERLIKATIAASRECMHACGEQVGTAVVGGPLECAAVQFVDNFTGLFQIPDLLDSDEYVLARGVDIGVRVFTPNDDLTGEFRQLSQEATLAAGLGHDLLDAERDAGHRNLNNLVRHLPDREQLWDILQVCLSHTCGVAGPQWQRVVAGFVVGTASYARGGRASAQWIPRVPVKGRLLPSREWTYAPQLWERFASRRCRCTAIDRTVDVQRELADVHRRSVSIVRHWRRNQWKPHFELPALQALALGCIEAMRHGALHFSDRDGAQNIF